MIILNFKNIMFGALELLSSLKNKHFRLYAFGIIRLQLFSSTG